MPDLIFRDTDPDEFRRAIVVELLVEIGPMLQRGSEMPNRIANRIEMAEILRWSLSKLDRRTKSKAIPSLLDGDRRSYIIDDVIEAIKAQTNEAERIAAERQATKQAAKKGVSDA